jgi:Na+-driven multidrug efflux pump
MEITRPNLATFKTLIKLGIPTTIEQAIWSVGQLVMSIYAGWLGIVVLATHQVFVRIQMLITMIFFGFGISSMSIVGKSLGADHDKQAKRAGAITALVGFVTSCFICVVLFLASNQIMDLFTDDSAVITLGNSVIIIFALIQLPKGVNIIYSGNLRGSADLNWLMWLAVFTATGYEIIGSWILAIPLGLGLAGIWFIQGIDELTRFLLNYWRFNKGEWKKLKL